jgi:hypothetical protein
MIVVGVSLILFGGSKTTRNSHFDFLGFSFGSEESEPMSRFESLFWGLALIAGSTFIYRYWGA